MTLKYESEILFDLMKRDGDNNPSDVLPYESELKEKYLNQVVGAYPKLQDYRPEWLNYNLSAHLPSGFPVETLTDVTQARIDNVVPYAYGSAILKGNTLINLLNMRNDSTNGMKSNVLSCSLKGKTKYIFLANVPINSNNQYNFKYVYVDGTTGNDFVIINRNESGHLTKIFTTPDRTDIINLNVYPVTDVIDYPMIINDMMIIEYQDGMENWDIPYFEGMKSVQMPVLTTTGKNLLPLGNSQDLSTRGLMVTQKDGKLLINGVTTGTADYRVFNLNNNVEQMKKFNSLPVGTTITLSNNLGKECYFNVTRNDSAIYLKNTITIEDGDKDINAFIRFNTNETHDNTELHVQIEYGAVATSYEPYKSNILTVNEEVELRGIGEVQDELNLLTGELTQRVGVYVLNGSENISLRNETLKNTLLFTTRLTNINTNSNLIHCDKFDGTDISWEAIVNTDKEFIRLYMSDKALYIRILKSKLATQDVNGFKQWLSKNPITIQYKLATESVKTVDLSATDHDGNNTSIIRPIEGTMTLSTSSDTIQPTFTGEVPVEAITQNLASFIGE